MKIFLNNTEIYYVFSAQDTPETSYPAEFSGKDWEPQATGRFERILFNEEK